MSIIIIIFYSQLPVVSFHYILTIFYISFLFTCEISELKFFVITGLFLVTNLFRDLFQN